MTKEQERIEELTAVLKLIRLIAMRREDDALLLLILDHAENALQEHFRFKKAKR